MHKAHVKADIEVEIETICEMVRSAGGRISVAKLEALPFKAALQLLYPNGIRFCPDIDVDRWAIDSKIKKGENNEVPSD